MPWGRCDDGYYRHRKVAELDDELRKGCIALYWLAVSWTNDQGTDGRVTVSAVRLLGGDKEEADELVRVGLWESDDKHYRIHDFLDFNRSAAQIAHDKEQRSEAGHRSARRRWGNASSNESSNEPLDAPPNEMDAPYPVTRTPLPEDPEPTSASAPEDDPADAYWSLTGRYPTSKTLPWIDEMSAEFGTAETIKAIVAAHQQDNSTRTLLGRAESILRAHSRKLDRKERLEEEARLREKRAIPRTEEPWRAEFRDAIQRQYEEIGA